MNKLDGLSPKFRARVEAVLYAMRQDKKLKDLGVQDVTVTEGLRTLPVQMAYYSRGRMAPDDVRAMYDAVGLYHLTDAEAKQKITWTLKSRHLEGKAVDIVPTKGGKLWWDAPREVWARMGEIGKTFELVWGGDWKEKDLPHFEMQERI